MESRTIRIEKGRDKGLSFKITEMSAFDMEDLLMDISRIAGGALSKTGGTEGDFKDLILRLLGGVNKAEFKEVLERMMTRVFWIDTDGRPHDVKKAPIKDVTTLLRLKKEVVALHISFLPEENLFREMFSSLEQGLSI